MSAEVLIDFRGGASGDGLSVGRFGDGVLSLGRIKGKDLRLVLRQSWYALASRRIFQTREFFSSRVATVKGAAGTRVTGRRLWGTGGSGHFWMVSSGIIV